MSKPDKKQAGRDQYEIAAHSYLNRRFGEENVSFEPNGVSKFPDFVVGADKLFEVTGVGLPIMERTGNAQIARSFEKRLMDSFCCELQRLETSIKWPGAFYVDINFEFPRRGLDFERYRKDMRKGLRRFVERYLARPIFPVVVSEEVSEGVSVQMWPSENPAYLPGPKLAGYLPLHGGFAFADLLEAIQHALDNKTPKLRRYQAFYSEAWLIMAGDVNGYEPEYVQTLKEHLHVDDLWTGIVILNDIIPDHDCELEFSGAP